MTEKPPIIRITRPGADPLAPTLQALYEQHPHFISLQEMLYAVAAVAPQVGDPDDSNTSIAINDFFLSYRWNIRGQEGASVFVEHFPAPEGLGGLHYGITINHTKASAHSFTGLRLTYHGYWGEGCGDSAWCARASGVTLAQSCGSEAGVFRLEAQSEKFPLELYFRAHEIWPIIRQAFGLAPET